MSSKVCILFQLVKNGFVLRNHPKAIGGLWANRRVGIDLKRSCCSSVTADSSKVTDSNGSSYFSSPFAVGW